MKLNLWTILAIIGLIASGYCYAGWLNHKHNKVINAMIEQGYQKVRDIDLKIDTITSNKLIQLDSLKKSKERIDAILEAAAKQNKTELTLDEALKIIQGK